MTGPLEPTGQWLTSPEEEVVDRLQAADDGTAAVDRLDRGMEAG